MIDRLVGEYGVRRRDGARHDQDARVPVRHARRAHGVEERHRDPAREEEILARYEDDVAKVEREYERGLMTEEERKEGASSPSGRRRPTRWPTR